MPAGPAPERQKPNAMVRPGSESRANVRKGFPGNLREPPVSFSEAARAREGHWHEQQPGTPEGDLAAGVSKRAKHEEVSMAERNEVVETDKGSRSVFIVALESRETDPREPASSQGRRRVTELPLGNTR